MAIARTEYSLDSSTVPFEPTWVAELPGSTDKNMERAVCFEGSPYRAAPYPHSGGFCYFSGLTADATLRKFIVPPDLAVTRSSKDESAMWSIIIGTPHSPFDSPQDPTKKITPMRGGLQWANASSPKDPRLCRNRKSPHDSRPVVLLTPWNNPKSLKHWAVTSFSTFSLQRHLKSAFGLRPLTNIIDRRHEEPCSWVNTTRHILTIELAKTGVQAFNEIPFARGASVPAWATGCFDAVVVAIGAGHTYDPTWFLDRTDALALRTLFAKSIRNKRKFKSIQFDARGPDTDIITVLATKAYPHGDADLELDLLSSSFGGRVQTMSFTILERQKRNIGNIDDLVKALKAHEPTATPNGRVDCGLFQGECDGQWRATDVLKLRMESLSALEQVRPMLSSHVFVVPHGAGNTHGSVMPPCSLVIEILPFNYPQLSFITPLTSSGHIFLQLYETTPTGNLVMARSVFNELCRKKLRIVDNSTAYADVPGFSCLYCKKCEKTAKSKPVMNVSEKLFLHLVDHGNYLRRRCLANFPHTEFLEHRASITLAGRTYFQRKQKPMAPQEAWRYHFDIPTIASSRPPGGRVSFAERPAPVLDPPSCLQGHSHTASRKRDGEACAFFPPQERDSGMLMEAYSRLLRQ